MLLLAVLALSLCPASVMAASAFTDVKSGDYFAAPVDWAVQKGITNGTSATTFSPNQTCTRAQILTFLWRAAGSPEPADKRSMYFDVSDDAYYCKASSWASIYGIVDIEGAYFYPDTPCTRAAAVEYIWRYAKSPASAAVSFTDVKAGTTTAKAVSWAVNTGVTNGTGGTTFSPDQTCTRGQIVTFLHRYFVEPLKVETPSTPSVPETPKNDMQMDPLPPEDYRKHADWYLTLTPAADMSNARLAAEYEQIEDLIDDYRSRDLFITDSIYSRQLDLWSQVSQRCDIIERYDRGVRNGSLSESAKKAYEELVQKHGDAEPLRKHI